MPMVVFIGSNHPFRVSAWESAGPCHIASTAPGTVLDWSGSGCRGWCVMAADQVSELASGLTDGSEAVRLRAMAGLTRYPHHETAVAELIESAKNDMLGELTIVAAAALADMGRSNPAVLDRVGRVYAETVGSVAVIGNYDPTLRLSYVPMVAGDRGWFERMDPAELLIRREEYRPNVDRYLAAGRSGDVRTAAVSMVWFEALDTAGQPEVFTVARELMPGWDHWFTPLARACRPRWWRR